MITSTGTNKSGLDDIGFKARRYDPQDLRLLAALLDAHRRVAAASLDTRGAKVCRNLLKRADFQASSRDRYVAWNCLHQIDDELLAAMKDEGEVKARWCMVRAEAEDKLKGSWRGDAAERLAKLASESNPVPLRILVRELQTNVATAAQNQHYKIELFEKRSLPLLTALLALAVFIALGFSWFVYNTKSLSNEQVAAVVPWAQAIVLGIPAGALGGILSMAFSLGRADLKMKIPELRLSSLVTLTRPLLGATVAIPILGFVQAGYIKFAGFEGTLAILAFCFVGGFSERWFLGVMERFGAEKQ